MFRYLEIAEALEERIRDNGIRQGERLTSVRKLCEEYTCHKSTALKALNYLVEKELIYSISQSGFYVAGQDEKDEKKAELIDLKSTSPDQSLFPYKDYQKCVNLAIENHRSSLFEYSQIQGYKPFKQSIAQLLTNDYIFTHTKNIVITTGIQQSLSLLTEMDFGNHKHSILIEQPTYHRYIEFLKLTSVEVLTIQRQKNGLDLTALEEIFKTKHIKFFYLMPRVHNVFGTSLSIEEKRGVVELAYRYDVYIVEDDYMGDYVVDKKNDPLITYDEKKSYIIYLRSFSKVIFPGLRVGFVILPTRLMKGFEEKKFYSDLGTSLLIQASLSIYINNGMYERHLLKMKKMYKERAKTMLNFLEKKDLDIPCSETEETAIVQTCLQIEKTYAIKNLEKKGIKIANISDFYYDDNTVNRQYLPINVSNVDVGQIEAGLNKLCMILQI